MFDVKDKGSLKWCSPVKSKNELGKPTTSFAVAMDESKKDNIYLFVYKEGEWSQESQLWASPDWAK